MNRLAVDFGNSNTVLALWDEEAHSVRVLDLPDLSDAPCVIPSLIHYETPDRFFLGGQIRSMGFPDAGTFRWMKRYIGLRSPYRLLVGGSRIDAGKAAEDYLRTLIMNAAQTAEFDPDEITFTVPVEAFEHYSRWLQSVMQRENGPRIRLVDEATAAAAGYGASLHPGDVFLVFDFGGSTMQAVCVRVTEDGEQSGRCCSVLGKAGCSIGGMTIDRWLYEAYLERCGLPEGDASLRQTSAGLLRQCEAAKIRLTEQPGAEVGDVFFTREDLLQILQNHELPAKIRQTIRACLQGAEDHGFSADDVRCVIPVGGSCALATVRNSLGEIFGAERVLEGDLTAAAAKGAATIAGGMEIYDFIQHDYAIRYLDPETEEYRYHGIIPHGTPYPTTAPAARLTIKGSFDGQTQLGIAIYELLQDTGAVNSAAEVLFEENGAARIMPLTDAEKSAEKRFWLNEKAPTFLHADPPVMKGERRFRGEFGIDRNKMLLLTVTDLVTGETVIESRPVVRLV